MSSVCQEPESPEEGHSRRIKAKEKWAQLQNVCLQYDSILDKKDYVKLLASVM